MENQSLEKLEKVKKSNWGGFRPGSGRKPLLSPEALDEVRELVAQHSAEVDETDKEKRQRVLILMEKLYEYGKKGNIAAVREYLDRQMGKSKESFDITTKGKALPVLVQFMKENETGTEDNRDSSRV